MLEPRAGAAATEQNFRPAAHCLFRWIDLRLSAWLVWTSVPSHGARLRVELQKCLPQSAHPVDVPALIREVDSTLLKAQQRGRLGPVSTGRDWLMLPSWS